MKHFKNNWDEDNGVEVVMKHENPPNCPEFRKIENYWGIVIKDLKSTGAVVQNEKKMLEKWKKSAGKVPKELVQAMMGDINKKVQNFIHTSKMQN